MGNARDILITLLTVIADTIWLFPILGMCGFILEQGGSPLSVPMIFLLIGAAIVATRFIGRSGSCAGGEAGAQALVGMIVIYVAMAFVAAVGTVDMLWGPRMIGGGFPGQTIAGPMIACAMAGVLWFRGVRIALETRPQSRLVNTFRAGLIGLSIAILAEQIFDADFHATVMIIPFFAVTLAALAFARMATGGAWPRTIGLAVLTVLAGGLLIGLVGAAFGGEALRLVVAAWNAFLAGLSWVLTVLLAPVLEVLFDFVIWLIGDHGPVERAERVVTPQERQWWKEITPDSVPPMVEAVIRLLKYPVLLAAIYLMYRVLLWAYRQHVANVRSAGLAERESIRGEANAANDLANLALGLLPDWMFRGDAEKGLRAPSDQPGITEAFTLYFDLLSAAKERGYEWVPTMTPRERQPELEAVLPGAPVGAISECFNAACYGNIAADTGIVSRLRAALEAAVQTKPVT
tara:strand:- start:1062 stop:2447 length:1386 start_codon:yes stop_codon:yes gene_type:complete